MVWALATVLVMVLVWLWNFGTVIPGLVVAVALGLFNWWFARSGGGGERLRQRFEGDSAPHHSPRP